MSQKELRADLIRDLEQYCAVSEREEESRQRIIELLTVQPRCFYRDCMPGHMTGAGLLMNKAADKVLMNHHKASGKWLCFGGHADGDEDIYNVARRETWEESGIEKFERAYDGIFDVDVHVIAANPARGEEAHEHFDVRFLFRVTEDDGFAMSDESNELRWCDYDEALVLAACPDMRRMLDKWQKWSSENIEKRVA